MRKISIIIFCVFLINVSAQVSGYMGKKFSVFINPNISIPHLNAARKSIQPEFTLSIGTSVEYIISKSIAFGVKYKYAMTNAKNIRPDINSLVSKFEKTKFSSHTVGPYFKFYSRKTLAPISTYLKLGGFFQILNQKNLAELSNNGMRPSYKIFDRKAFDFVICLGVGKNFILADRILLGFEVEAGVPLYSHGRNFLSFNGFGDVNENYDEFESIFRTNFANEILKVSLNLGFLAF
ncbi:MAG: hypothetical protein ACPGVH_00555 [Chitinophagales bacterium]